MDFDRRKFIGSAGVVAVSALAGCSDGGEQQAGTPVSEGVTPPEDYEPAYIGSEDADLVIQEFYDLGCPACAQFHGSVYPYLYSDYINEGTVALEMYDYAFGAGEISVPAANGAREVWMSTDQDSFVEYITSVYDNQSSVGETQLIQFGVDVGVPEDAMRTAVEDQPYQDQIESVLSYGSDLGVSGTPTIRVADRLYGFPSFEELSGYIEAELESESESDSN